jgi:hypothetical protein
MCDASTPRSANPPSRAVRRRAWRWLPALLLLPGLQAQAAEPAEEATRGFIKCLELRDPQARLACYDRMAVAVVELGLALPGSPGTAAPATAAAAAPAAAAATAPEPEQEFGLEQERAQAIDSVRAGVVGGFQGWSGDTVFELDNGQVWQQTGSERYEYSGEDRAVVITRGFLGSFSLQAEGLNRTVRVKRIK